MPLVTINVETLFGSPFACVVVWTSTVSWIDGVKLVPASNPGASIPATGTLTINVLPGNYTVAFYGGNITPLRTYTVGVPNDSSTHQFTTLINTGVAIPPPPASSYPVDGTAQGIVDIDGGGATKLDGIVTFGTGSMMYFVNAPDPMGFGLWHKIPGTNASDKFNGWQRPTDYNAVTNAVVWRRRL